MLLGVNCPMERKQRCFDVNAIGLLNTYVNAIFDTLGQVGRLVGCFYMLKNAYLPILDLSAV